MIRKLLIASAAVAAIATAASSSANAKVHFDINVGVPGVYAGGGYPVYGGYDDGYYDDENCGFKVVFKKKWNWNHSGYKIVKKKVWVCY
jgi:ABC-type nitrate/sulfonate/bicarbonate transport system substrate-binding protein